MAAAGFAEFTRTLRVDYVEAYSTNWGNFVTDSVLRLLGRPPRGIGEFAAQAATTPRGS